jgi:hypothetical protein
VDTFSSLPALSAPVFMAPKNGSLSGPATITTDSFRPEELLELFEPVESVRLEQAAVTAVAATTVAIRAMRDLRKGDMGTPGD